MDNTFVTKVRQRAMQTKVNRGGLTKHESAELAKWAVEQAGNGKEAEIRKALTIMGVSAANITDVLSKSRQEAYALTNPVQRKQLVQATPQRNHVAKRGAIGNEICGGAAVASALIFSSKDKAKARANAEAVKTLLGSYLTGEQKTALENLGKGTMGVTDLAVIQRDLFTYANSEFGPPGNAGLSPKAVGMLVKALKEKGAFAGDTVVAFKRRSHWTVTVNGTFIDTDASPARARVSSTSPHTRSQYGDHVEAQSGKRTTIKAHEGGSPTPTWYDVDTDSSSNSGYRLTPIR